MAISLTWFICYAFLLLLHLIFSVKSLKITEMRNRFHLIITLSLLLVILIRVVVEYAADLGVTASTLHSFAWTYFLKFQLPYDLVNLAIIS